LTEKQLKQDFIKLGIDVTVIREVFAVSVPALKRYQEITSHKEETLPVAVDMKVLSITS